MKGPRVSIVIPTYNHLEDCLMPCIQSILQYTDMSDKEIVVVANGCTDATVPYINSLIWAGPLKLDSTPCIMPIKLVINSEPLGYTKATNLGVLNSDGEYIIFLNNDTVLLEQPKDQWINLLIDPLKDTVGITGPLILKNEIPSYPFVVFFCAATKRSIINEIGLLNEVFSPGGCEDIDFCIRIQQKGYTLAQVPSMNLKPEQGQYVGGFPIYHKGEATFHESLWSAHAYNEHFESNKKKLAAIWSHLK